MRADRQALARYTYPTGALAFMQELCPTEGGHPFTPTEWELEATRAIYEGQIRPRVALVGLPRGYGKSEYLARLAWYELICRGEHTEIFCCAGDRDQARIIHQRMVRIRRASPLLAACTKEYRDAIEVPATGALFTVLSADAPTSIGLQPHLVLFDELHI